MKLIQVSIIIIFFTLSSCASNRNISALPINIDDFNKPLSSLENEYPEINVYKQGNKFFGYCTPIQQLEKIWGDPNKIEIVWAQMPIAILPIVFIDGITTGGAVATGIAYTMFPEQPKHYIWYKGNITIDAYVGTDIFCGYDTRLMYWNWIESKTLTNKSSSPEKILGLGPP